MIDCCCCCSFGTISVSLSLDKHSMASGLNSCKCQRPPGKAVSGYSPCSLVALSTGATGDCLCRIGDIVLAFVFNNNNNII